MIKRFLATLIAIGIASHLTGCTSSAPKDESDVATSEGDESFTEEKSSDFQDETKTADGEAQGLPAQSDLAVEDGLDLEQPQGAAPGGDLALDDADPDNEFPESVAQAPPSVDDPAPDTAAPPTDESLFASSAPAPVEPSPVAESPPIEEPAPFEAPPATPKPERTVAYAPLLKIKDQPFSQKGALLNRVYVARQQDTWKSVSEKIYGMNDSPKLKSWNPGISGRPLRVGDKVYYNSPRDASDSARMLTYHEEMGIPPQTYTTKDGDNLRPIGEQLLGDKNSWKELWVTNRDLAGKGALPAGLDIRYWPEGAQAVPQTVASAEPPAPPSSGPPGPQTNLNDGLVPPPVGAAGDQPMMDPVAASNGLPPDPAAGDASVGAVASPEPPPPPPPPPVAAAPKKPRPAELVEPDAGDQDTMMMLGAGAILLLAAVATFVVIRKNRAKRIDLSQTQV